MRFVKFDCAHIAVKHPKQDFGIARAFHIRKDLLHHQTAVSLMPAGFQRMNAD